jgi:predicted P-loop ATPase/GTPase
MVEDNIAISPGQASAADYWRERAVKARRLAQQHGDQVTRDHLMKIVAGYEELAAPTEDSLRA